MGFPYFRARSETTVKGHPTWAIALRIVFSENRDPLFGITREKIAGGWRRQRGLSRSVIGEEARVLHQGAVALVFFSHPVGEFLAGHEGLVERPILHEFLPLRR